MKKTIRLTLLSLLLCMVIFPLLLVLSCTIPKNAIEKNGISSIDALYQEGVHPRFFFNSSGCMMDNYTDMIILSEAMCVDAADPLVSAMRSRMVGFGDPLFEDNYKAFVQNEPISFYRDYSWYWHGYLIFVRPLLVLTDLAGIRAVNCLVQFGLALALFLLSWKKLSKKAAIGFLLALLASFFIVVPFSVQYGSVYLIALTISLLLFLCPSCRQLHGGAALLLVSGCVAAFLDLLTAPLVTFGFPAMFFLLFSQKEKHENSHLLSGVNRFIVIGISWCLGFALFWIWKWVLGSICLGENIVAAAMEEAAFMSVNQQETSLSYCFMMITSFLSALAPIPMIARKILRILLVLCALVSTVLYGLGIRSKAAVISHLPYLLVALIPFAWCIVFLNHVTIHFWFVFRIFSLTAFGTVVFVAGTSSLSTMKSRLFRKKSSQKDT